MKIKNPGSELMTRLIIHLTKKAGITNAKEFFRQVFEYAMEKVVRFSLPKHFLSF